MRDLCGKRIHFIGINGTGTSALMGLSHDLGAIVSGSDQTRGEYFDILKNKGLNVYVGTNKNIVKDCDLIVYSGAVKRDHPEYVEGKSMERGEYLGYISSFFDRTLAVAGTHGKTTTTAMISHVLRNLNKNFGYMFGGIDVETNTNYQFFGKKLLVLEACEYRNSFLSLKPDISVITAIEYDHPDFFTTFDSLVQSFDTFATNTKNSLILANNLSNLVKCKNAHVHICDVEHEIKIISFAQSRNDLIICYRNEIFRLHLKINGKFNFQNALLAFVTLTELKIAPDVILRELSTFEGVKRRQEIIGYYKGKKCISDYAHHPTQIKELIDCFADKGKVTVVFEPHTYSRTKKLLNEFASAFERADKVILLPVYPARETYDIAGDSRTLFDVIRSDNKILASDYDNAKRIIDADNSENLLFVGAGSIDKWARSLIS